MKEYTFNKFIDDTNLGGVADGTRCLCCHPEGPQEAGETG